MKTTTRISGTLILLVLAGACSSTSKGISPRSGGATAAGGSQSIATSSGGGHANGGTDGGDASDAHGMVDTHRAEDSVDMGTPDSTPYDSLATDGSDAYGTVDTPGAVDGPRTTSPDSTVCDGTLISGTWYRALDGLTMYLISDGCSITGSADGLAFRHRISGTYDSVTRTMIGKVWRTNAANGCTTILLGTWVLTDPNRLTAIITSSDGACELLRTFTEQTAWVRK